MKTFVTVTTVIALLGWLLTIGAWPQMSVSAEQDSDLGQSHAPAPTPAAHPKEAMRQGTTATWQRPGNLYARRLLGAHVKNAEGERVGTIDELVIDPQGARISMAIVSQGGFFGLGAKYVAIPWRDVTPASDGQTVIVQEPAASLGAPQPAVPVQ